MEAMAHSFQKAVTIWLLLPALFLQSGLTPARAHAHGVLLHTSLSTEASSGTSARTYAQIPDLSYRDCPTAFRQSEEMKMPSFYHTSEDGHAALIRGRLVRGPSNVVEHLGLERLQEMRRVELDQSKGEATAEQVYEGRRGPYIKAFAYSAAPGENLMDAVRIRRGAGAKTNRMAVMFSEHGRELISMELGYHLIKALCNQGSDAELNSRAQAALENTEFLLIPNVDENGRQRAEQGQTCSSRDNEDGVDLNRNWDYMWQPGGSCGEGGNGPHAFSEPETMMAKQLLEEFNPTSFLSIHSGANGLYNPGAATTNATEVKAQLVDSWDSLLKVADSVKAYTGCQTCATGAAGEAANKEHPGASLDYVALKMNVHYSQAWEVYMGDSYDCMPHFSPEQEAVYTQLLKQWTTSMLYFAEATTAALNGKSLPPILPAPAPLHSIDTKFISRPPARRRLRPERLVQEDVAGRTTPGKSAQYGVSHNTVEIFILVFAVAGVLAALFYNRRQCAAHRAQSK